VCLAHRVIVLLTWLKCSVWANKMMMMMISLKFGVMIGPTSRKNWLTFGGDPVPDTDIDSRSLFNLAQRFGVWDSRRLTSISHTVSHRPIFKTLGKMTDADKRMNPLHFGSDLADIRIRIRINPKFRIRIRYHFCFRFWLWRRFALSEHSLVLFETVDYVDGWTN